MEKSQAQIEANARDQLTKEIQEELAKKNSEDELANELTNSVLGKQKVFSLNNIAIFGGGASVTVGLSYLFNWFSK